MCGKRTGFLEAGECRRRTLQVPAKPGDVRLQDCSVATSPLGDQEAEEEARHAWVTPGFVRDLRTRHGLDEATIGDLVARVGRMASSFGGQK